MPSTCYSCRILLKPQFSQEIFEKILDGSSFMKIRLVGAELFRADGQTDITKRTVDIRSFATHP